MRWRTYHAGVDRRRNTFCCNILVRITEMAIFAALAVGTETNAEKEDTNGSIRRFDLE